MDSLRAGRQPQRGTRQPAAATAATATAAATAASLSSSRCQRCGGWGLGVVLPSGFCGHCERLANVKKQRRAENGKKEQVSVEKKDSKKAVEAKKMVDGDESIASSAADAASSVADVEKDVSFADLGLIPQLCDACARMNYLKPTPIQVQSIPPALEGRDIIGLAETGSGKTAAFALPVLQALMEDPRPLFACVMSPTRELAVQIARQFEALGAAIGLRCAVIVGGVDKTQQAISLARRPHVVVGTPGRILEHLENTKGFHLRTLRYLVLDEADRLLSMDFEEEINKILSLIPRDRKTMLFSATMTSKVQKLQRASVRNAVRVEVSSKFKTVDKLLQHYVFVAAKHKDAYLVFLLNEFAGQTAIVFVATRKDTQRVALLLRNLGFGAIPIHGQLSQAARFGSLNKFSSGERNILIATDVAGRGLDIPSVDLVINYDIPANPKDYIHRVGRTARAQRSGRALSIVSQYDVALYQRIEQHIGKQLALFEHDKAEVMLLQERVQEAQRFAALELKESGVSGRERAAADDDDDSDADTRIKKRKASRSGGPKMKRKRG